MAAMQRDVGWTGAETQMAGRAKSPISKGRITAQRYLLEHMAEATLSVAFVQARYAEYSEALATNPNSIPDNIKNDMERVMRMVEYSTARPRSRIRMTTPPKQKRRRS